MVDVSKMVSDRVAVSRTVLSSLHVHGAEVSEALEKLLFPKGPPAHLTVSMMLAALGQVLEQARSELMAADLANAAELADDEAPRVARDQALAMGRTRRWAPPCATCSRHAWRSAHGRLVATRMMA